MDNFATIEKENIRSAKNLGQEKETVKCKIVLDEFFKELIRVRWYKAKRSDGASPVYCSVWLGYNNTGHGVATGWGYCKHSAALGTAINSAGIKLEKDIDGRGEEAIDGALLAIARVLSDKKIHIVDGL